MVASQTFANSGRFSDFCATLTSCIDNRRIASLVSRRPPLALGYPQQHQAGSRACTYFSGRGKIKKKKEKKKSRLYILTIRRGYQQGRPLPIKLVTGVLAHNVYRYPRFPAFSRDKLSQKLIRTVSCLFRIKRDCITRALPPCRRVTHEAALRNRTRFVDHRGAARIPQRAISRPNEKAQLQSQYFFSFLFSFATRAYT